MEETTIQPIRVVPTPKQLQAKIEADTNDILLYGGAIRGGKSFFLCLYAWSVAFKYPNSRWLFLRENMPTMRQTLLVTFNRLLDIGFRQYVVEEKQGGTLFVLNNGSEFLFMSENYDKDKELNRFRGLEINGAFIDEINELQEVTLEKVIERSGSWFHSPGCPSKIVATCNPTQGWVKKRFYDPWKNGTLPPGYAYVPAKITDNPHVPEEYKKTLRNMNRYQYEVFVNGAWDINMKTGGEFYKCFEMNMHVAQVTYNPSQPLHISFDENVNPYLPMGIYQITISGDKKQVRKIAEIAGEDPNNTIDGVCNEFMRMFPGHMSGLFIYGDATAKKEDVKQQKGHNFFTIIAEKLKRYKPQLRISKANPSVAMRGQWLNTVLEKQIGGISVIIGETCFKTISDFVNTKEAADGTKHKKMATNPKTGVRYQEHGHFTDEFDYFMCFAFAKEFEDYQRGDAGMAISVGKAAPARHGY